jgi:hypothetical protein
MRSSKRQRSTPAKLQQQADGSSQPAQRKHKKQKKELEATAEAGSSAAAAVTQEAEAPAEQQDGKQEAEQHQQHDGAGQEQPLMVPHSHQQQQQQQQTLSTDQEQQLDSPMQQQQQQQQTQQEPSTSPATTAAAAANLSPAAAAAAAVPSPARMAAGKQPSSNRCHPLQKLPASFPYVTKVTLQCRSRSSSASERALPAAHALAASLQLLGQLPKLQAVLLQGSLPRPMWQPLLAGLQQQQQQQQDEASGQATPVDRSQPAEEQHQLRLQQLPRGSSSSSSGLQQKLVCLQLVGCDLPPAVVLEGLLGCLRSLRELLLHASIKSPALQVSAAFN